MCGMKAAPTTQAVASPTECVRHYLQSRNNEYSPPKLCLIGIVIPTQWS